jgi:hypothetical protein
MKSFRADLKIVVADQNMKAAFTGLLTRHHSLGVRPLDLGSQPPIQHPRHDPGCWKDGPDLLAIEHQHYRHGLLALDWEGCNSNRSAEETRQDLQTRLEHLTSPDWGFVVLLQPELEIWLFAGSDEVDRALGWSPGSLTPWLLANGHLKQGQQKPRRPKEAVEQALREVGRPRSSSIYRDLAQKVSFSRCEDDSFLALKATLQHWFPLQGAGGT